MILIKNLCKDFGNKSVFKDLNLEIPSNKLVFVVGKSGIGKSTLLKLIGGYDKSFSGSIDFIGYKNFDFENIDFVFQDFNLIKGLTALENMQIGVNTLGLEFDKNKSLNILRKINISDKESNQKIENLSGGEQQRVAIARSILRNSQILLTDEPTGNLDFENSELIFEYLKEISNNKTVVVVTHDIDNARKYGDFIVEIKKEGVKQYYINQEPNADKHTFETSSLIQVKKNLNKFRLIPKFVKNDVKRKIFQMLFVIFAFVATVIAFGTLMQFRHGIEEKSTTLKTSYLQTDKASVKNRNESFGFPEFSLELFEKLPNLKYLSKIYPYEGARLSYGNNETSRSIEIDFIDFNEFYKQRMVDNISLGSFPVNDNEVIISEKLTKELKIENPIGKTIFYNDQVTGIKELKIAAVNDVTDIENKNMSFVSNEFIKKSAEEKLSKLNDIVLWKEVIKTQWNPYYRGSFTIIENLQSDTIIKNDIEIDKNYPPIWISSAIVQRENLKLNDKIRTDFKGRNLLFNLAGIITSKENTVSISQDIFNDFNQVVPTQLSLYFDNDVNTSQYIKNLIKDSRFDRYELIANSSSFAIEFSASINNIFFIFEIVVGILLLISILFTLGFTKILNDTKKREIGLLKSLGASLKQILMYHVSYFVLVNFIVLIISLSLFVPSQMIFISFFENSNQVSINYLTGFGYLFLMWIINFATTAIIYYLFSLVKFRKNITKLVK